MQFLLKLLLLAVSFSGSFSKSVKILDKEFQNNSTDTLKLVDTFVNQKWQVSDESEPHVVIKKTTPEAVWKCTCQKQFVPRKNEGKNNTLHEGSDKKNETKKSFKIQREKFIRYLKKFISGSENASKSKENEKSTNKAFFFRDLQESQKKVYHNYARLTKFLKSIHISFPHKTYLSSIGRSNEGRELWLLSISESTPEKHKVGRPELLLVGNIHGNEIIGRELILRMIAYLLIEQNKEINFLLKNTRINFLPVHNPDGSEKAYNGFSKFGFKPVNRVFGRYNYRGFDLNRSFPDYLKLHANYEPEVTAYINFIKKLRPVLALSYHGGALGVIHPSRSTLDFSYLNGLFEIIIEVSCNKYPDPRSFDKFWTANKLPMLNSLMNIKLALHGVIMDKSTNKALTNTKIYLDNRNYPVYTNANGEFWRLILPGVHTLKIKKRGYKDYKTKPFEIVARRRPKNILIKLKRIGK